MTYLPHQVVDALPPGLQLPNWLDRYPAVAREAKFTYAEILRRERRKPPTYTDKSGHPVWVKFRQYLTVSEKIEILSRLATDERMERVWRELYRKKRGSNEFLNPVKREGLLLTGKQLITLH